MGKHTKRNSGYLPKVAAGAAPFALLLAGPATALAATGPELPVQHHNEHSFHRGLEKGVTPISTPDSAGYTAFVRAFVDAMNKDTYTGDLGGATFAAGQTQAVAGALETAQTTTAGRSGVSSVDAAKGLLADAQTQSYTLAYGPYGIAHASQQAGSSSSDLARGLHVSPQGAVSGFETATTGFTRSFGNAEAVRYGDGAAISSAKQALGVENSRGTAFSADPVAGTAEGLAHEKNHVVAGDSASHAVTADDNAVFSDSKELVDSTTERSAAFSGSKDGHAHSTIGGGQSTEVSRGSAQGVTFGKTAGGTVASGQGSSGSFSGILDTERRPDGSATVISGSEASRDVSQVHAVGGHLGAISAAVASEQKGSTGSASASETTLSPAGKVDSAAKSLTTGKFSDTTAGTLGIGKMLTVSGSSKTTATAATGVLQSTKDGKPGAPEVSRAASVRHDNDLRIGLLGQKPVGGGVSVDGAGITPHLG